MHISPDRLRAYLDEALPGAEQAATTEHLAACAECRSALAESAQRAALVRDRLAALAPAPAEAAQASTGAWKRLRDRQRKERSPMLKTSTQRRMAWIAAAALVLALSFSLAPVRIFAGQFLGLFRVQQITVLPVDMARLETLHNDPTLSDQVSRMFSDAVTVIKEPGEAVAAADEGEAEALAGFDVRQLGGSSGSATFSVHDSSAFEMVVNQPRAQAILDEAGRSDLRLPEAIDGAVIAVEMPKAVNVAYNCMHPGQSEVEVFGRDTGHDFNRGAPRDCVLLSQIPSPSVETPPNLDLEALAEIGLQFAGMSANEARAFSQSVDWTSTLVVPIPMEDATSRQVNVDGVTGTVVHSQGDAGQRYTLFWVKDGIVYALSGFGTPAQAVALANTIR